MSRKEQLNSFSDGIITDKHPLVLSKSALTDALNATMTTYNGNELILQNDMGNTTLQYKEEISKNNFVLKTVQLSPGFQPIGMKEHGGILYILSQKDTENADGTIKHEFEIGSFPGPDYTADSDEAISYTFRANNNENFEDLKTIVDLSKKIDNLYEVFPVKLLKSGNEDLCVLRVGLEFILVVENYDGKLSDKTTKKFYKLKFINLDDSNKDITDYVKFGTQFILNPNSNQNSTLDFYYFPNIKTTSLGVKFELEDIEYFRLAENQTEGYDQARFPTFDFLNYELTFDTFEYESKSYVKMDSFNMKLTITDKTSGEKLYLVKNTEGENVVSETSGDNIVFLSDGKKDDFKYTFSGLTWKLKHGNYILDYVIYPRWVNQSLIETDEYYSKVFEKHVIRESLDLTLIPSLWGGEETVSTHPYFELDKVLCGDLEWSNEEDTVDIGIFWQNKSNIIKFDFLAEAQKDSNFIPLRNVEPLGDISEIFPGLNEKNYILQRNHRDTQLPGWEDQVDIIRFKLSYGWDKTDKLLDYISKDNLIKKECPVYVYDHIYPVKSPNIQNINYYNNIASVNLYADITTNAQKPSPNYYKKGAYVIGVDGCHIDENKTAASPVWQFQSLRFKGFEDIEYLDAEKSTIKQLSFPRDSDCIESTTDAAPWKYLPISTFSFNGLNWNNDESSDKENVYTTEDEKWLIQSYNLKAYTNSAKLKNITLEEGSINIEILSKIYYIFAHNYKLPENQKDLVDWNENKSLMLKNDLNPSEEEIKNIKTFFQNSHFCPTEIKEASKYLNEPNRRTDTHKIKEAGGFVQFPSKEFALTEPYIVWFKENNNGLGYYYWDYTIDNKTVLQFENLSKGTIQTAFLKTRSYDGDLYYFSTNNAYKTKEIPDFESEIKHPVSASKYNELRSNYKILKEQFKSSTLSNYPILNPYPIESSDLYYNFITVSSKDTIVYFDEDDTISEGDICNISFYVGAFGYDPNNPVTLEISTGYTFKPNKKIFIQNSKLERDSNGKVIESGFKESTYKIPLTDKYLLIQVVGEFSNPRITFSVTGNGTATIRNIILTKVGTKPEDIKPRETCAISVYYNDKTFVDYSPITGNNLNKIWGGGKQYCYLPLPFFQIEDGENWCYTDDENGQTIINGEIYQIL